MDFTFSPDTIMLRDMLRKFIQKDAQPLEMKYFNAGKLEPEEKARLRTAIQQLGIWGITLPESLGGGLDLITTCVIEEELGTTFIPIEIGSLSPLLYACQGEQIGRFVEPTMEAKRQAIIAVREPGSQGVHPDTWTTAAEPDKDGYTLTGRKVITTNPSPEDFFIIFARAPEGQTAFLVENGVPGSNITKNQEVILQLDGCKVSREQILGEIGGALSLSVEDATHSWISTGARYLGICERLIAMSSEHARTWISLGAPLAARPAIQRMLAEMQVDIESCRWLVYHAAWLVDEGKKDQIRSAAAEVRLATGEMLKRSVDRATMMFNGPGTSPEIEPHSIVRSLVPYDALELALSHARSAIADGMLNIVEAG